jgi:hypothetical protein
MKFQSLVILLAACSLFAQETSSRSYLHSATGMEFPPALGEMQLSGIADYEEKHPGLGVALRYDDRKSVKVDVYIYNLQQSSIPDGIQSGEIRSHFRQCEGEIYVMEKRGQYQGVRKMADAFASLDTTPAVPAALWGHYSFVQDGTERYSHLYLTVYHNHFVKLRITYPKQDEATASRTLDGFLKAVGKLFSQPSK